MALFASLPRFVLQFVNDAPGNLAQIERHLLIEVRLAYDANLFDRNKFPFPIVTYKSGNATRSLTEKLETYNHGRWSNLRDFVFEELIHPEQGRRFLTRDILATLLIELFPPPQYLPAQSLSEIKPLATAYLAWQRQRLASESPRKPLANFIHAEETAALEFRPYINQVISEWVIFNYNRIERAQFEKGNYRRLNLYRPKDRPALFRDLQKQVANSLYEILQSMRTTEPDLLVKINTTLLAAAENNDKAFVKSIFPLLGQFQHYDLGTSPYTFVSGRIVRNTYVRIGKETYLFVPESDPTKILDLLRNSPYWRSTD